MDSSKETLVHATSVIAFVLLAGCITYEPMYVHPDFDKLNLRTIALLPVLDKRMDRSLGLEFEERMQSAAQKWLSDKGYEVMLLDGFSADGSMQAGDVAKMENEDLALLVPDGAGAVALVSVVDIVSDYRILAYDFEILASSAVVSRSHGVAWYNECHAHSRTGGLISGAWRPMDQWVGFSGCLEVLFGQFPKR